MASCARIRVAALGVRDALRTVYAVLTSWQGLVEAVGQETRKGGDEPLPLYHTVLPPRLRGTWTVAGMTVPPTAQEMARRAQRIASRLPSGALTDILDPGSSPNHMARDADSQSVEEKEDDFALPLSMEQDVSAVPPALDFFAAASSAAVDPVPAQPTGPPAAKAKKEQRGSDLGRPRKPAGKKRAAFDELEDIFRGVK